MAGATRLELATSGVTDRLPTKSFQPLAPKPQSFQSISFRFVEYRVVSLPKSRDKIPPLPCRITDSELLVLELICLDGLDVELFIFRPMPPRPCRVKSRFSDPYNWLRYDILEDFNHYQAL